MGRRQTTKRCHWVPQSYLRAFSVDPKADRPKIWRFGKTAGDPELKPLEKVAVKFHLYAPAGADGRRDDRLERKLASLEGWFGGPVWRALCSDFIDLEWGPLRKMVALLAATMYLRNPLRLAEMEDIHRRMVDFLSSAPALPDAVRIGGETRQLDPSGWPEFRDADEDAVKRMWLEQLDTAAWLAETMLGMRWAVLYAEEPVFVTSDNPVAVLHPSLRFKGLSDPDTAVSFPISPTRVLMMDNRHGEPASKYYPLRHDPAATNLVAWRHSIEHMFSPRHPDEVCAEMLADAEREGFA